MEEVEIGSVWVDRKNPEIVKVVTAERMDGSLRNVLLTPVEGSRGRVSWKWDKHVPYDMVRRGEK